LPPKRLAAREPLLPGYSNLVGHVLDIHLCKLASDNGCTYSRYADDITFSTNEKDFPPAIAYRVQHEPHQWGVGHGLQEIIAHSGFPINPAKTRMQYWTSRQDVIGLVVNSKVNIRSEYRRTVRAMAQNLFMTGKFDFTQTTHDVNGAKIAIKKEGTIAQLHGMLGHIDRVDRYNVKLRKTEPQQNPQRELSSKESLYRRFLIFKEFYANPVPMIVCEGKTDTVYLTHAIRSMGAHYPELATVSADNKVTLKIRMFKYPESSTTEILRLTGGAAVLNVFLWSYLKEIKRFKAPGKQQPVIFVVDNDSGAGGICGSAKTLTNKDARSEPFVHLSENLYLVVLPLPPDKKESEIEDFMGNQIKGIKLDGKTYSRGGDSGAHFGKHILSQHIDKNAQKFDFTALTPVLERISAAIHAHHAKTTAPVVAA
jgi:RNA-directed DNA polymerase